MKQVARPFHWQDRIRTGSAGIALAGYTVVLTLCCGFGVWAATAPLDEAAVAPGVVSASGQNTTIQHLEGGIIRSIVAKEGDYVKRGDPLVILDTTAASIQLNRLTHQLVALQIKARRLESERDGATTLSIPMLENRNDPAINAIVDAEKKEFSARLARFNAENEILEQRVASLKEAVEGLRAQKNAADEQIAIVKAESDRKKALLDKGLTNRTEYSELLRANAALIGQAGQIEAQIASSFIQRTEASFQIERQTTSRVEQAASDLNATRISIADIEEQMKTARAVLDRTTLRAPADGVVIRSMINSVDSVIMPGAPIMEILPTNAELIVDARVRPEDVDKVRIGQAARMHFRALNARTTPEVAGEVFYVSADRLVDPRTNLPYYAVRLKIVEDLPTAIPSNRVFSGMPVDSSISIGQRTFAQYLVQPILDSFDMAFREE